MRFWNFMGLLALGKSETTQMRTEAFKTSCIKIWWRSPISSFQWIVPWWGQRVLWDGSLWRTDTALGSFEVTLGVRPAHESSWVISITLCTYQSDETPIHKIWGNRKAIYRTSFCPAINHPSYHILRCIRQNKKRHGLGEKKKKKKYAGVINSNFFIWHALVPDGD